MRNRPAGDGFPDPPGQASGTRHQAPGDGRCGTACRGRVSRPARPGIRDQASGNRRREMRRTIFVGADAHIGPFLFIIPEKRKK